LEAAIRAVLLPGEDGEAPPQAKVTSRKELARLAARFLPAETAAALVLDTFALPGQHPDVRAACVSVAVGLLPTLSAWSLLEQAATGLPVLQAPLLGTRPFELRHEDRRRYAGLVFQVAGSEDRETADAALERLSLWAPWRPEAGALLVAAIVDLDNRTSWGRAADALTGLAVRTHDAAFVLEALERLLAAEAASASACWDAAERDRPARQRISRLVERLVFPTAYAQARDARSVQRLRETTLRTAELLGATADFLPEAAKLRIAALDLDAEPARVIAELDSLAALHAERPILAQRTASTLRHLLAGSLRPGDPLVLLCAAQRLTAQGSCPHGLFALAITRAVGSRTRWSEEWRTQLRTLRHHPQPEVRDAALAEYTTTEA
jgi:hypothetical protein